MALDNQIARDIRLQREFGLRYRGLSETIDFFEKSPASNSTLRVETYVVAGRKKEKTFFLTSMDRIDRIKNKKERDKREELGETRQNYFIV